MSLGNPFLGQIFKWKQCWPGLRKTSWTGSVYVCLSSCFICRPPGTLIINHIPRGTHGSLDLIDELNPNYRYPSVEDIETELKDIGFQLVKTFDYRYVLDFRNPDQQLVAFYSAPSNKRLTIDEFQSAVEKVWPNGQCESSSRIEVYRRP